MIGGWVGLHLLYLSVEDIRDRQISMTLVAELGGTGLLYSIFTGHRPCLFPGLLLLLAGLLSEEAIGYGDGWLILAMGAWMGMEELLFILFLGTLLGLGFALCFRKREIPLVPFLSAAYFLEEWVR